MAHLGEAPRALMTVVPWRLLEAWGAPGRVACRRGGGGLARGERYAPPVPPEHPPSQQSSCMARAVEVARQAALKALSTRSGLVSWHRGRVHPTVDPALGAEGGTAVALQFGGGDEEARRLVVGEADGGEVAAEDVLLDGGGAEAAGGGGVPLQLFLFEAVLGPVGGALLGSMSGLTNIAT